MGTDIHLYVEHRVNGRWESADKWTADPYVEDEDRKGGEIYVDYKDAYYHDRNYNLFAILADVRNGRGFAGMDTGDGFVPIVPPRGLPHDLSPALAAYIARGAVDHTPSWLTVAELMAYNWTQKTHLRGVVNPSEWARWRDHGSPNSWSEDISGGSIRKVKPADMERVWQTLRAEKGYPEERNASVHLQEGIFGSNRSEDAKRFREIAGADFVTTVEWEVSYYDQASEFLGTVLPRLWRLGKSEDVRIVFWFDS